MKLFLKRVALLSVLGLFPLCVYADRSLHGSRGGDVTADYVGALPCDIDSSTGTGRVICGSTDPADTALVGGETARLPGIVYGVIATSVAPTNYLIFRDTKTANATTSTHTMIMANADWANSAQVGANAPKTVLIKLPVPILFREGICVESQTAIGNNDGRWTILYRTFEN